MVSWGIISYCNPKELLVCHLCAGFLRNPDKTHFIWKEFSQLMEKEKRTHTHTPVLTSFQYPPPNQYHSLSFHFVFPLNCQMAFQLHCVWLLITIAIFWVEFKKREDLKKKGRKEAKRLWRDMIDAVCALSFTAYIIYIWEIVSLIVKETKSLSRIKYIRDTEQFFIWFGYHSLPSLTGCLPRDFITDQRQWSFLLRAPSASYLFPHLPPFLSLTSFGALPACALPGAV